MLFQSAIPWTRVIFSVKKRCHSEFTKSPSSLPCLLNINNQKWTNSHIQHTKCGFIYKYTGLLILNIEILFLCETSSFTMIAPLVTVTYRYIKNHHKSMIDLAFREWYCTQQHPKKVLPFAHVSRPIGMPWLPCAKIWVCIQKKALHFKQKIGSQKIPPKKSGSYNYVFHCLFKFYFLWQPTNKVVGVTLRKCCLHPYEAISEEVTTLRELFFLPEMNEYIPEA